MILKGGTHFNIDVFDANGEQLFDCIEVDTESGAVTQWARNHDGKPYAVEGELMKKTTTYPAPITWVQK